MDRKIGVLLHNKFDFELRDAKTNELKQRCTAYNIILDQMFTRLCNLQTFSSHMHIGTGSGEVSEARTSLFNFLAARSVAEDYVNKDIPTTERRLKITLNPEEYVDYEITEVGLAYGTSSTNLTTHALLQDSEGGAMPILKTDTDVLIIYATIYFTLDLPEYANICGMPNDNILINYLCGSTMSSERYVALGSLASPEQGNLKQTFHPSVTSISLYGTGLLRKSFNFSNDIPNKKLIMNTVRFGVAEANGHIQEVGYRNFVNFRLPNDVYEGSNYTDVPLTGQDGTKKVFHIPSRNVDPESIVVKLNNNVVEPLLIPYTWFTPCAYNMTTAFEGRNHFGLAANSNYIFAITYQLDTGTGVVRRKIYPDGIQFFATNHGIDTNIAPGASANGVFLYATDEAITRAAPIRLFNLIDGVMSRIDLSITGSTYDAATAVMLTSDSKTFFAFVPDNNGTIYRYDRNIDLTWTLHDTPSSGVLTGTAAWAYFAIAPDDSILILTTDVAPYFRVYKLTVEGEYELYTDIDFSGLTIGSNHVRVGFSADSSQFAICGCSGDSLVLFKKVDDEWVQDEVISTDSNIFGAITFIDNDTIVTRYSNSNNTLGMFKRVDGTWYDITTVNTDNMTVTFFDSANMPIFEHNNRRYLCIPTTGDTNGYAPFICPIVDNACAIVFDTAPAPSDTITVSYTVKGIHKTSNYVVDVGGYVQFSRGDD
jgi:hypothetical protein